ncbi:MAG TPA: FKBP-type peptidyl-prolyl cis-trans isomerase [Gammaproteobacteria bacterium]
MYRITTTIALALCLSATMACAQDALETDEDRTLYALGIALGTNVQPFALSAEELSIVEAGIRDSVLGNEPQVDMNVYGPQLQAFAQSRAGARAAAEKDASDAFLAEMAQESGAEVSATGVIYIPMTAGTGASPTAANTVRVHYHGTLRDGTVFDSSVDRGEPISFPLTGVIPCWTEGVQKMMVGGKSTLVCPSDTAYGDAGQGPIPGGAALVFEVELLGIE